MDTLNDDCILYICRFLSIKDKIHFFQTCTRLYNLIQFKNDIVVYNKTTKNWIKQYKPKIEIQTLKTSLKKVHCINLSDKQLSSFNTTIVYKQLNLSSNYLKIWPILPLQITWLDLSYNKLWNIPLLHLQNMKCLQYLNLENNKLTCIPTEIENLQHLKFLNLSWNRLLNIPDELYNLKNLENLNLEANEIEYISKNITRLQNLTSLNLACNKINKIPDELKCLSLINLSISDNILNYSFIH